MTARATTVLKIGCGSRPQHTLGERQAARKSSVQPDSRTLLPIVSLLVV